MLHRLALVFIFFLNISNIYAADILGARAMGLAGSTRGGPLLNEALHLNPAFESFLPVNSVSFNWIPFQGNSGSGIKGRNYTLSVFDGRSTAFQAGLAFTIRNDLTMVHVGASKALLKQLGIGLGAKYLIENSSAQNAQDVTFSVVGIPLGWLQTAFIIDNLVETDLGKRNGLNREYIVGLKVNLESIFLMYLDPHYIPSIANSWGHAYGMEFVLMKDLFLRFGGFRNTLVPHLAERGKGYSVGLGWLAPRISFDFSLYRTLEPVLSTATGLGATIYF
ncbi:MAG: hypothetical protein JNL01_03670 [Bdellovibrionales bacterium]|nr:hypothetical protein [Bdellovibrionales bacterium]